MKPRRFPMANCVFELVGGNEDNSLWVERTTDAEGQAMIRSVWVPTDEEREQIAAGANICLAVWGQGTPPVSLLVTPEQPGKGEPSDA